MLYSNTCECRRWARGPIDTVLALLALLAPYVLCTYIILIHVNVGGDSPRSPLALTHINIYTTLCHLTCLTCFTN